MHIKAHTTRKNTKNLSIVQNNLPRPPGPAYSEDRFIGKDSLLGRLAYSEDRFIGNRPKRMISLFREVTGIGRKGFPGSNSTCTRSDSESIAALIFRMSRMPFDPMKCHPVRRKQRN